MDEGSRRGGREEGKLHGSNHSCQSNVNCITPSSRLLVIVSKLSHMTHSPLLLVPRNWLEA